MVQRSSRFLRNLFCALGHVLLDQVDPADILGEGIGGIGGILGLLAMAALCTGVVICFCLFFQIGYELMFDPNATDVAARLASVSISPERWI
jgi:hypothetical protein